MKTAAILCVLLPVVVFAQNVLVDDAPMCGHHDRYTYQALWDTLISAGCTVDFTTDVGRYPDLSAYDFVVLMHHGDCSLAGFTDSQKEQLIDFVCSGGQILIMPMDNLDPLDDFLSDPRWNTGVRLTRGGGGGRTTCIAPFSTLTDGIEYLEWGINAGLLVNPPAYPFVWDNSCERVWAAVSYPQGMGDYECNTCETGGRIIVLAENHTYEYEVVGYVEPMSYRFIVNILTSLAGVGDTLNPCQPPEGIPRLDSIPCASPGEVAHLYGDNIPPDINLYFNGSPISFTWVDSTEVMFTVPSDAEQGYYVVAVEVEGHRYGITMQVYCDWLILSGLGSFCGNVGDTVWFYGQNFSSSTVVIFGGEPVSDYQIVSDTSGWFVVPDTAGLTGSRGRYQVCVQNAPTQRDCSWFRMPCECPPDSEIVVRIENVRFWERTDGTDTVYIVYDLVAESPQNIVLWCSSDGGATWDTLCGTVFGAVGSGVAPGESLVIIWAAGTDIPDVENTNWMFSIEAVETDSARDSIPSYSYFVSAVDTGISWDSPLGFIQLPTEEYVTIFIEPSPDSFVLIRFSPFGDVENAKIPVALDIESYAWGQRLHILTPCIDGGYAVLVSDSMSIGEDDLVVLKFLSSGNLEWAKVIGTSRSELAGAVLQLSDGGYVIVGNTHYNTVGAVRDLLIAKFDSSFHLEWAKAYGDSSGCVDSIYCWVWPREVIQTYDGGYCVVGDLDLNEASFIAKFDSIGNMEWIKVVQVMYSCFYSVLQMSDSGYVAVGYGDSLVPSRNRDLLLAKFSNTGDVEWIKAVGDTGDEKGFDIIQTPDGGFVVIGGSNSYPENPSLFVKFSLTGGFEWGEATPLGVYSGAPIISTIDSGYATVGKEYRDVIWLTNAPTLLKFDSNWNTCNFIDVTPQVTDISPPIYIPNWPVRDVPLIVQDTFFAFMDTLFPDTLICSASCPFGAVYASAESDPGPIDTWCPRITATCPPDGEVGEATTITWTVEDSFIPPNTFAPAYPIKIYFSSDGGASWDFVGTSDNSGSFNWVYPSVITSGAYIMVCATDSFGHTCCDTCGPFTITGDTVNPWGYAYADTCSPADVFFILHDDVGIDWGSVCIQDPLGVLCYPDSMDLVGDTMIIFHPRLPDSIMDPDRYFYVRLWSAWDSSGNEVPEMLVDDSLTVWFRHPCADTTHPWGYAYADTCSPADVFFILHDNEAIDWSSVCIQDPLGVLCYPDSMDLVGDTMIIFHPRLPDSIMDATRYFYVRLWSATDSSGNDVPEGLVDSLLTVQFRHPCCYPAVVWRVCPPNEWNGWTTCAGQGVTFGVVDTTGQGIDTTRIYIRRIINGIERTLPPDSLIFSHIGDTLWITVPGGYSDTDSVWILLDSLFTEPGCRSEF